MSSVIRNLCYFQLMWHQEVWTFLKLIGLFREDVASYIHRVGRTARFSARGKSVLFIIPTETKMIKKLEEAKIPVHTSKPNMKRLQPVSGLLVSLLVKYPDMQYLAQKAFSTYLRAVYLQRDKEVFDVTQLPIEEFSASLGLPITPKMRILNNKIKKKSALKASLKQENGFQDGVEVHQKPPDSLMEEHSYLLLLKGTSTAKAIENEPASLPTRISKKKKLKVSLHRPIGTRVVDDEGNTLPPLAALASTSNVDCKVEVDKVKERYAKLKEEMKQQNKEDKLLLRQRLQEKRLKEKNKLKRARREDEDEEVDDHSGYEKEAVTTKRSKVYFSHDSDEENVSEKNTKSISDSISLAEQEALALKLLSSMHS